MNFCSRPFLKPMCSSTGRSREEAREFAEAMTSSIMESMEIHEPIPPGRAEELYRETLNVHEGQQPKKAAEAAVKSQCVPSKTATTASAQVNKAATVARDQVKSVRALSPEEKERKRMEEIDSIASAVTHKELINEAKYGDAKRGISPYSAAELAFKDAQKRAQDMAYADVDAGVRAVKGERGGIPQG